MARAVVRSVPIAGRARARAQQDYEFVRLPRCFRNGLRNYSTQCQKQLQYPKAYNTTSLH